MDKCKNIPMSFGQLCKDGADVGIHIIGWWMKQNMFKEQVGFGNDKFFDTKIALRLDERATQEILGPLVKWSVRDNRALVSDATEFSENVVLIPYSPLLSQDVNLIESKYKEGK
jgi:hypothetical protein